MLCTLLALCEGNPPAAGGFPSHRVSNVKFWYNRWVDSDLIYCKAQMKSLQWCLRECITAKNSISSVNKCQCSMNLPIIWCKIIWHPLMSPLTGLWADSCQKLHGFTLQHREINSLWRWILLRAFSTIALSLCEEAVGQAPTDRPSTDRLLTTKKHECPSEWSNYKWFRNCFHWSEIILKNDGWYLMTYHNTSSVIGMFKSKLSNLSNNFVLILMILI